MSAGTIVAIIVAVVVIAAIIIGVMAVSRRRRLQQRFGPEYDRLVGERDSKRKAEAELTERQRRVQQLDIRPLTDAARAGYAQQWANLQEQFVDAPVDAVGASQLLVVAVMNERGYPIESRDQVLADLSVEHADTLDRYRAAEKISASANAGTASTEDLRQAMIHYRVLFRELLGDGADTTGVQGAGRPAEDRRAGDAAAQDAAAQDAAAHDAAAHDAAAQDAAAHDAAGASRVAADTRPYETKNSAAGEPVSNRPSDGPGQRTPRS
jgi:hypothetical protein